METEMVRTRYVGTGKLKDRRLGGLGHIQPGHAVDMPRHLAEEMIAQGLFVLEGDYPPPAGDGPDRDPDGVEVETEGAMQSFVEIGEPGRAVGGRPFVEIGDGEPLAAGELPGLGEFKLEALARAGVGSWQVLAALSDEECERLAGSLAGISAAQLKQWRTAAASRLSSGAAGGG